MPESKGEGWPSVIARKPNLQAAFFGSIVDLINSYAETLRQFS